MIKVGDEIFEEVDHTDCSHKKTSIAFDAQKWRELQHLMHEMGHLEFAAYLLGTLEPLQVQDHYIPEQEVSGAAVEIGSAEIPPEIASRIVGHLHSHHHMGAFHSGTDEHNMNYPVNIVISHEATVANVRMKMPCGSFLRSTAEVVLTGDNIVVPGRDRIKVARPPRVERRTQRVMVDGRMQVEKLPVYQEEFDWEKYFDESGRMKHGLNPAGMM